MTEEMSYYPVFLNLTGRKCLVVGGGEVARRKVGLLWEHGAAVSVVSPEICPELAALGERGGIAAHRRAYRAEDLADCFVVIAATDDSETNRRVSADARRKGVLVNVVDDAGNSDFILPASLSRGAITVAVATAGKSPALARKIRDHLDKELSTEYARLAELVSEVRGELRRRGVRIDAERWQEALELEPLLALLRRGENGRARDLLLRKLGAASP
ncbi:MAG: bifunctional precorrin-2 dehydrogenase/sirohydrochlorin ferrochelatase [Chloroflexota bacterium]